MLILIIKEEIWMKKRNLIGYHRCSNNYTNKYSMKSIYKMQKIGAD